MFVNHYVFTNDMVYLQDGSGCDLKKQDISQYRKVQVISRVTDVTLKKAYKNLFPVAC